MTMGQINLLYYTVMMTTFENDRCDCFMTDFYHKMESVMDDIMSANDRDREAAVIALDAFHIFAITGPNLKEALDRN